MRVNKLRQQRGDEKQRLGIGKLNEQALKKEAPPRRQRGDWLCHGTWPRPETGYDDARAKEKEVDRADGAKDDKSSRCRRQQRAESECDASKEHKMTRLNPRNSCKARPKPVPRRLRHRTDHGWSRTQCHERPRRQIE